MRFKEFIPTQADIIEYSIIIFRDCKKEWGISDKDMGDLIMKYKLSSLIGKHFNYFNSMGNMGAVEELEAHIRENGGTISGDNEH